MRTAAAIVAALLVCLIAALSIEEHRVASEQTRAAKAALGLTNAIAERDSTRNAAAENQKVARLLGDSLAIVERHVVQVEQKADALDDALGRERVARYAANASVDSLTRILGAPVRADSSARFRAGRHAMFELRKAPYTVHAEVTMPSAVDSVYLALRVALDTAHVEARVSCAPADANGIRAASVEAETAPWLAIRLGRVEQSPEVCASPALRDARRRGLHVSLNRLLIGGGLVAPARGGVTWGLFVGSGLAIQL